MTITAKGSGLKNFEALKSVPIYDYMVFIFMHTGKPFKLQCPLIVMIYDELQTDKSIIN